MLYQNAAGLYRKTTFLWVSNVVATGFTLKQTLHGRPQGVWMPENVNTMKQSILSKHSPRQPSHKHASTLRLSDQTKGCRTP